LLFELHQVQGLIAIKNHIIGSSLSSFVLANGLCCCILHVAGFCGGVQWVEDLLSAHLLHVLRGRAPVSSHVPVPGEKTLQVWKLVVFQSVEVYIDLLIYMENREIIIIITTKK